MHAQAAMAAAAANGAANTNPYSLLGVNSDTATTMMALAAAQQQFGNLKFDF